MSGPVCIVVLIEVYFSCYYFKHPGHCVHFVYSRMMLTVVLPFSTNWLWIRSRGGPENCISLLVRHGLGSRFMVLAHVLWSGSRFMVLAHVHVLWSWLTVMVMAHVVWTWLTFLVLAHVLWSCHTFYVIAQVLWSWFMFYGHAIRFMSYWCFMVMAHVLWPWLILYDHWQILHDPWLSYEHGSLDTTIGRFCMTHSSLLWPWLTVRTEILFLDAKAIKIHS